MLTWADQDCDSVFMAELLGTWQGCSHQSMGDMLPTAPQSRQNPGVHSSLPQPLGLPDLSLLESSFQQIFVCLLHARARDQGLGKTQGAVMAHRAVPHIHKCHGPSGLQAVVRGAGESLMDCVKG